MPLLLIGRPAFLAHFGGLDSISPTVFPAHTFILSELIPVYTPLKVITQRYLQFLLFLRDFLSGNARYLSCAITFCYPLFCSCDNRPLFCLSNTARVIFTSKISVNLHDTR